MSGVRVDYTSGDDRHLVEYLTENSGEPRFGNTIYRRLVEDLNRYPWAKRHSWQSWRERYKKHSSEFDAKIRKQLRLQGKDLKFVAPPKRILTASDDKINTSRKSSPRKALSGESCLQEIQAPPSLNGDRKPEDLNVGLENSIMEQREMSTAVSGEKRKDTNEDNGEFRDSKRRKGMHHEISAEGSAEILPESKPVDTETFLAAVDYFVSKLGPEELGHVQAIIERRTESPSLSTAVSPNKSQSGKIKPPNKASTSGQQATKPPRPPHQGPRYLYPDLTGFREDSDSGDESAIENVQPSARSAPSSPNSVKDSYQGLPLFLSSTSEVPGSNANENGVMGDSDEWSDGAEVDEVENDGSEKENAALVNGSSTLGGQYPRHGSNSMPTNKKGRSGAKARENGDSDEDEFFGSLDSSRDEIHSQEQPTAKHSVTRKVGTDSPPTKTVSPGERLLGKTTTPTLIKGRRPLNAKRFVAAISDSDGSEKGEFHTTHRLDRNSPTRRTALKLKDVEVTNQSNASTVNGHGGLRERSSAVNGTVTSVLGKDRNQDESGSMWPSAPTPASDQVRKHPTEASTSNAAISQVQEPFRPNTGYHSEPTVNSTRLNGIDRFTRHARSQIPDDENLRLNENPQRLFSENLARPLLDPSINNSFAAPTRGQGGDKDKDFLHDQTSAHNTPSNSASRRKTLGGALQDGLPTRKIGSSRDVLRRRRESFAGRLPAPSAHPRSSLGTPLGLAELFRTPQENSHRRSPIIPTIDFNSTFDLPDGDIPETDKELIHRVGLTLFLKGMSENHGFREEVVWNVYNSRRDLVETDKILREMREEAERVAERRLGGSPPPDTAVTSNSAEQREETQGSPIPNREVREWYRAPSPPSHRHLNFTPIRDKALLRRIRNEEEFSPPATTRAASFARLVNQGRREEAFAKERRRSSRGGALHPISLTKGGGTPTMLFGTKAGNSSKDASMVDPFIDDTQQPEIQVQNQAELQPGKTMDEGGVLEGRTSENVEADVDAEGAWTEADDLVVLRGDEKELESLELRKGRGSVKARTAQLIAAGKFF